MDLIYENTEDVLSKVASSDNCLQRRGNSSRKEESKRKFSTATWTKILLILAVSLVFALGSLCVLGTLYVNALKQLSEQNAKSTIMVRDLTANYCTVREQLSFYEAFTALNCNENLKGFQGKLYFFSSDKLTWSSSRDFCLSKGADLVTITSKSEQEFLHSQIKTWYWIGLNDLDTEGHWVWMNNQTLNETGHEFWFKRQSEKSEPDNWKNDDSSGENCAFVKHHIDDLNNWFDVSCMSKEKFICEKYPSVSCAN